MPTSTSSALFSRTWQWSNAAQERLGEDIVEDSNFWRSFLLLGIFLWMKTLVQHIK